MMKVHYHVHNGLPSVHTTNQINRVYRFMFYLRSILILHLYLCQGLPNGLFSSRFLATTTFCIYFSPRLCKLCASPTSPSFIWSSQKDMLKTTNYEACHYAVFPGSCCCFLTLGSKYPPQHPALKPLTWQPKFHIHTKQWVNLEFCNSIYRSETTTFFF